MIPKLSTFIIGLIAVSLVAAGFAFLISDGTVKYGLPDSAGNLSSYDKMVELSAAAEGYQKNVTTVEQQDADFTDILGTYFSGGYKAIKVVASSAAVYTGIATDGVDDLGLGVGGGIFITAIVTALLVLIFVGIVLSALVKREM